MVRKIKCECSERYETKIDTWKLFEEIKKYFEEEVLLGTYEDIPVTKPYYVGHSDLQTLEWYADKWYKCKNCGCLWEFVYPDFPANGFVRKFPDGVYSKRNY
jgi:acetone carboxylase gamma subunit